MKRLYDLLASSEDSLVRRVLSYIKEHNAVKDITDHKQAEEALRESEEMYRTIFETTGTATVIIEEDTTISLANTEFEKLSGYSKEEIEGKKSWTEFYEKIDLDTMKEYHHLRRVDPDAAPRNYESQFIDRQGNNKHIFNTVAIIPGTKKSVAAYMDITERKRAEDHIRREAVRAEVLAEVSQALAEANLDYRAVLGIVSRRTAETIGDACIICLLSDDGQHLNHVAFYHPNPQAFTILHDMLSNESLYVDRGLVSRVLQNGQPLLIPVIPPEQARELIRPEYWPYLEHFGINSIIIVPLRMQGRVIGTLSLSRDNPGQPYTTDDQLFLQEIAHRVALAIANARLYSENLRQLKTISSLYASTQILAQSLDLHELAEYIVRTCVETFGARLAWLDRAETDDRISLLSHFPQESEFPQRITARRDDSPPEKETIGRDIRSGFPVIITDISSDPDLIPWQTAMLAEGFCTSAAFPLISRDRPFGILNLYSDQPGFFTPKRVEFFQAFVHQAAAALENARLFKEAERRFEHLQALRNIDMTITASMDLRVTLNVVLDQVTHQLGVHATDILLLNPHTQTLEYTAGRGFRSRTTERSQFHLGEDYAGRAIYERRIIKVPNLPETGATFMRAQLLAGEGFIAYYGVPLIAKGQVKGLLEVFHRAPLDPDQEWLDFLETLAGQAAIAIDNATLFDAMQQSNTKLILAYDATIEGWSRALDMRDKETEGHSQRVTEMTIRLARAVGMNEAELVHVHRGALLHDIGKMGIPDNILLKTGPLTEEEWQIMRCHPIYALEMLSPVSYLRPALDIPYCHHEKWDGTGYPRRLRGEQIPLSARIFAVVDVWDALCSDRPYRPAWPEEKAHAYIRAQAGKHFDPKMVELYLEMKCTGTDCNK